jgi:hypothetical protein
MDLFFGCGRDEDGGGGETGVEEVSQESDLGLSEYGGITWYVLSS